MCSESEKRSLYVAAAAVHSGREAAAPFCGHSGYGRGQGSGCGCKKWPRARWVKEEGKRRR